MKKLTAVLLIIFMLCGCAPKTSVINTDEQSFLYGVWVTYAELSSAAQTNFSKGFEDICINAKKLGANALFVHLRAFCDSIYPSTLFPLCSWAENKEGDMLLLITQICKKYDLALHGWINPYRVATAHNNPEMLPENSPVKKNPQLLGYTAEGLYLNPASAEARRLVIDGVREIIDSYDIDGIHFDDYFYPTTDESFDRQMYNEYCSDSKNPLDLGAWRRVNVNLLISGVYSAIKSSGKDICFSVSPAADIEKNKNSLYADVKSWCEAGYIDMIIPQLYFGFDYPTEKFTFEQLVLDWIKLTENSSARLCIGLAPYKLDTQQTPDSEEWKDGTDIVARQVLHIKNQADISGAVFFSSSYLFREEENYIIQKENISKAIKE